MEGVGVCRSGGGVLLGRTMGPDAEDARVGCLLVLAGGVVSDSDGLFGGHRAQADVESVMRLMAVVGVMREWRSFKMLGQRRGATHDGNVKAVHQ